MERHLQNGTLESIWSDVFLVYQHQNRKSVNGSSQHSQRYASFILSPDIRWNCRFIATVIRKAALNISIGCRIVSVASKLAWLAFGLRSNTI